MQHNNSPENQWNLMTNTKECLKCYWKIFLDLSQVLEDTEKGHNVQMSDVVSCVRELDEIVLNSDEEEKMVDEKIRQDIRQTLKLPPGMWWYIQSNT